MEEREGYIKLTGIVLATIATFAIDAYYNAKGRIELVEVELEKRQQNYDNRPWYKRILPSRPCLTFCDGDHQHDLWEIFNEAHGDLRFFGKYRHFIWSDKIYMTISNYNYLKKVMKKPLPPVREYFKEED